MPGDRRPAPRGVPRRLRVLLATLTGHARVAEACAALGVGRSRFYVVRRQVLQSAVDALRGQPRGRPRHPPASEDVRRLHARIRDLELTLRTALLRSEIALTMPFLLDRAGRKKKRRPPATSPASAGRVARARPRRPDA